MYNNKKNVTLYHEALRYTLTHTHAPITHTSRHAQITHTEPKQRPQKKLKALLWKCSRPAYPLALDWGQTRDGRRKEEGEQKGKVSILEMAESGVVFWNYVTLFFPTVFSFPCFGVFVFLSVQIFLSVTRDCSLGSRHEGKKEEM